MKKSVIISTYNGSEYVIDQLKSIASQSVQPDEVLIFDDCSTDDTVSIIQSFLKNNDLSWTLTINERNKGWQKNFIDGIDSATGDMVFLCDQDDIWHKDKIKTMSHIMDNNSYIDVLVSDYRKFKSNDELSEEAHSGLCTDNFSQITPTKKFFTIDYPGCTYLVRKSFFNKIKQYWRTGWAHDALIWRFAMFSESLYKCEDTLHYWRQHSDSSFAIETNRKKKLKDRIEWVDYANDFTILLLEYIEANITPNHNKLKQEILSFKKWLFHRKKLFISKNPIQGLILIKYMCYYRNFKHYLGDIYNTYFNR